MMHPLTARLVGVVAAVIGIACAFAPVVRAAEADVPGPQAGPAPEQDPIRRHRVFLYGTHLVASETTCDCAYHYEAAFVVGLELDYLARLGEHFRYGIGARGAYGRSDRNELGNHQSEFVAFIPFLIGPSWIRADGRQELDLLFGVGFSLGQMNISPGGDAAMQDMTGGGVEAGLTYTHATGEAMAVSVGIAARFLISGTDRVGAYSGLHTLHAEVPFRVGVSW